MKIAGDIYTEYIVMNKNVKNKMVFVQYDDNDIHHVEAGPEYGQPWRGQQVWDEIESEEYVDFVLSVQEYILSHKRIRI